MIAPDIKKLDGAYVTITINREFKIRIFIARILFWIAFRILGCNVSFKFNEE
jgi:hypothetical protein